MIDGQLRDDPDVQLYFPQVLDGTGLLLVTGSTRPPAGAAEVRVELASASGTRVLVAGVSPVSRRIAGARGHELLYLDDGRFFALLDIADVDPVQEVRVSVDFSPLVRRQAPVRVGWAAAHREDFDLIRFAGPEPDAVRRLVDAEQLRVLAIAVWSWLRASAGPVPVLADDLAVQVGEAMRRSTFAVFGLPLLTAGLPRRLAGGPGAHYAERFDLACDALRYGSDAEALVAEERALNGTSGWVELNQAHVDWGRGDVVAAEAGYATAARSLDSAGLRGSHVNDGVFTWRPGVVADRLVGEIPGSGAPSDVLDDDRIVHLVACDDGYFRRFGNACIASSLRAGPEQVIVHVHVADPSEETLAVLRAWEARADVMVRFSTERLTVPATTTLYTCLRFLQASTVAGTYGRPLMITDIDMLVNRPWAEVRAEIADADAAFIAADRTAWLGPRRFPGGRPWAVSAGAVYFARTDIGTAYLGYVEQYVRALLSFPDESRWYQVWSLDQVALGRGLESVVLPAGGRVRNLRQVRFFRGPAMAEGGKATLGADAAPGPADLPPFG